jgi:hypothetical protein
MVHLVYFVAADVAKANNIAELSKELKILTKNGTLNAMGRSAFTNTDVRYANDCVCYIGYTAEFDEALAVSRSWVECKDYITQAMITRCTQTPNLIRKLDVASLKGVARNVKNLKSNYVLSMKYIAAAPLQPSNFRQHIEFIRGSKKLWEYITFDGKPKPVWDPDVKPYYVGQLSRFREERLEDSWCVENTGEDFMNQCRSFTFKFHQLPSGASGKQSSRCKVETESSTSTDNEGVVEKSKAKQIQRNSCAPLSLARALAVFGDRAGSDYIASQSYDFKTIQKVTQDMVKAGYTPFQLDLMEWDMFKNKIHRPILVQLLDTAGEARHCITVIGSWYIDSNFDNIRTLSLANLHETCGFVMFETDYLFRRVVSAVEFRGKTSDLVLKRMSSDQHLRLFQE